MNRWFVPGRIEFLGKHTDYAGGPSLVCAVERGFSVEASPRQDRLVRIRDENRPAPAVELQWDPGSMPPAEQNWTVYAATVVRRLARNFPGNLRGADITFRSDLPRAAGLSSSSALVTALFTALGDLNHLSEHPAYARNIRSQEDLAGYLGCIENGQTFGTLTGDAGVGTFGGSEDHAAILCSRPGQLSLFTFCPVRGEGTVPVPEGHTFVIGASGVAAKKTGDAREKYNRAALAAFTILRMWNEQTGRSDASLRAVVCSAKASAERLREILRRSKDERFTAQALLDRFEHFLEESQNIVPAAVDALTRGDVASLGRIVDASQAAAERLLGNQIPETIELVRLARAQGAVAASAFGAGFGGSVWALVRANEASGFCDAWQNGYRERFSGAAAASQFFVTGAGPGLTRL